MVTQKCSYVNITYIHGHKTPATCAVLFKCATDNTPPQTEIVNGTSECLSIREHHAYNILAIDGDAS